MTDKLTAEQIAKMVDDPPLWTREDVGFRTADELAFTLIGRDKAIVLLNRGYESTCEDRDRLKQQVRELEELIRLRCGYIVGACRGEREMKLEAEEMLKVVEKKA